MRSQIKLLCLYCLWLSNTNAQQLTVEKIMRDPKWIGTQPTGISWSWDNSNIFFSWNPEKNISDSGYRYSIAGKEIAKAGYIEQQLSKAIQGGAYNSSRSQIIYTFYNDIFLLDIKTGKTTRVTQTEEAEYNPKFIQHDQSVCFTKSNNLFAWDIKTGATLQLTDFVKSTVAKADSNMQEQWLRHNQLQTSEVLRERRAKKMAADSFFKYNRNTDTLVRINIGDRSVQGLEISPDGRFVTYRLYTAPVESKTTIVPNYVTESGFTTDIEGRTNVGEQEGKTEFFVFDRQVKKVLTTSTESIPGIKDRPAYLKDYPGKDTVKPLLRNVTVEGPYWNGSGSNAFVEIRSQDNKDRWLMQLEAATGAFKLIDRQRDEAWVNGPGIGYGGSESKIGWINDQVMYYQSEATGYSHVYTYNVVTSQKSQLTKGDYEVSSLSLSNSKKYFYFISNAEHPGKQNWYRMNVDGSDKQKITGMTGGYEVTMSPDEKYIAYRYSYSNKPWELYVQENLPGKKAVQITNKAISDEFKSYPWRDPEMVKIPARDGAGIYGRLYQPEASKKNGAAVVFVHGAGYLHNVHYWWSSYFREFMFNNLLADQGYTVIDVDYRASEGYGRDWRTGIYRYMGGKDLDDNMDAIHYLVKNYGIDPNRVGMYGGSYGGFITLMALFTRPDSVKAGAALRPVTDWSHYNHGYTSNILNEPFTDSIAYARSSPINFASGLKNNLLICHGMVDVNVHFQDVVRLTQRLIELGKDNWQIAPYPVEDHGFVEPSSWTDEYKRILKLFDSTLLK